MHAEHSAVLGCSSYLAGVDAALRVPSTDVVAVHGPAVPAAAVADLDVNEMHSGLLQDVRGFGWCCSCEHRAESSPEPQPYILAFYLST